MRRALLAIAACSACAIGPRIMSAPMLSSVAVCVTGTDDVVLPEEMARPAPLEGSYSGRAWHTGNTSWSLEVTFETRGGDVIAHAHYPDQHCRAEWRLRPSQGQQWAGEETVQVDPFNRCPRRGHIVIDRVDERSLTWHWTGPGGAATAELNRAQP